MISNGASSRRGLPIGCLFALALSAGASQPVYASARSFDVVGFFEGRTEGQARLKVIFKSPKSVRVQSRGRKLADGGLLLVQDIAEEGKPRRTREWRMREVSPGRFSGTLSDAGGPVVGEVQGNRFHVRYAMKNGLNAEQWLTLQPDGRTVRNVMHVTKLKLRVATLEETIRKLD